MSKIAQKRNEKMKMKGYPLQSELDNEQMLMMKRTKLDEQAPNLVQHGISHEVRRMQSQAQSIQSVEEAQQL